MRGLALLLLALALLGGTVRAQTDPQFDVRLSIDARSAEETVRLLADEFVDTRALAAMRGNRIAASTAGLIADRGAVVGLLADYLDSLKYHQIIRDDVYRLEDARRNLDAVAELLKEVSTRNFGSRVAATVAQIFPADAAVSIEIPVYVVALGHENVDAFVRRIVWHGDAPEFVRDGQGELTIVVNVAHAVEYGPTLEDRYVNLLGVVAHEVFHAAFGAYKDRSPLWRDYAEHHKSPFHRLVDLAQNEGIAYYLSMEQHGPGAVPRDWNTRSRESFATFTRRASELLSPALTPPRAGAILREANLAGFWESFGSMTGMFIAREIDRQLGRAALIETIEKGPLSFFAKYDLLTKRDATLPELPQPLRDALELR